MKELMNAFLKAIENEELVIVSIESAFGNAAFEFIPVAMSHNDGYLSVANGDAFVLTIKNGGVSLDPDGTFVVSTDTDVCEINFA